LSTSNLTGRLARACARHRRLVVAGWALALLTSAALIAGLLGSALTTEDDFTGQPESQRAEQVLERSFPAAAGDGADETVIVSSETVDVSDTAFKHRLGTIATDLRGAGAEKVGRGPVADDGHSALLLVELRDDVAPIVERVIAANGDGGFRVLVVGEESIDADFSTGTDEDLARGEAFGLLLALIVLVLVFGTVVAAVVPIGVALTSIVVSLATIALIGQAYGLNFVVVNVLVMMGLAVGIDYSLFVLSRFRQERRAGRPIEDAVATAGATASRAVLFSGITVVLALVGMFLVPQTIFRSIAVGAIAVVLVSVLAALTLLPATLAMFGDRVERLRVPFAGRGRGGAGLWSRVMTGVLRRPRMSLVAGVAVLVALAVP